MFSIGFSSIKVLKLTESGERLRISEYCSRELYDIMMMCWNLSAESRPKFSHLRNLLHDVSPKIGPNIVIKMQTFQVTLHARCIISSSIKASAPVRRLKLYCRLLDIIEVVVAVGIS